MGSTREQLAFDQRWQRLGMCDSTSRSEAPVKLRVSTQIRSLYDNQWRRRADISESTSQHTTNIISLPTWWVTAHWYLVSYQFCSSIWLSKGPLFVVINLPKFKVQSSYTHSTHVLSGITCRLAWRRQAEPQKSFLKWNLLMDRYFSGDIWSF